MIKSKKEKIEVFEEVIKEMYCDRCQKDLGTDKYSFSGGHFMPCFTWMSKYDSSLQENTEWHLCDKCWEEFFDDFVFDYTEELCDEEKA